VMRRPESGFNYSSISRVLKTQGYYNIFIHGGALDFDNMQNLMIANDFDKMVGKDDFAPHEGIRSTWGIDDYSTFKRVIKELDQIYSEKSDRPFFTFVLSTTTHAPYDLYDPNSATYKPDAQPEWQFLNSFRYSDWAIGKFFEMARRKPWFADTVFILTADHTHHTNLNNDFDNQRVPLWIYSPKYLKPETSHHIGADTDIASTVYQLVGVPLDATFGQNLLNNEPGFAYWMGSGYGWFEDRFIYTTSKDGSRSNMMDYSRMDFQNDLVASNPQEAADLRKKVLSFAQLSDELIRHNHVAPDNLKNSCK
jgi:phosphoglycerol transferase MdoB-like AlkP superfamily enzyme